MPPFVSFFVEFSREFPVGFRRYDWDNVARQQIVSQPVRIKCPVRQQVPGGQVLQQEAGFAQVVGLPRHQAEIDEVSKCIGQRQYFRGYSAPGASNSLAQSPPFAP